MPQSALRKAQPEVGDACFGCTRLSSGNHAGREIRCRDIKSRQCLLQHATAISAHSSPLSYGGCAGVATAGSGTDTPMLVTNTTRLCNGQCRLSGAACDVKRRQALAVAIAAHDSVCASTQRHQRRNVLSERPEDCNALQINEISFWDVRPQRRDREDYRSFSTSWTLFW